jgi:general secretion pathway protein I
MNRTDSARRRGTGFTLVEVLVALVIVALGMLGAIEAISESARNGSFLRDKTIAHWVAMNQLTATRLAAQPPKIEKSSDEVDMVGRRWRWTMEVTQTPVDTIRRIEISVRPEEADEESSLASITGFYGSAVAQPGTTVVMWQGQQSQRGEGGPKDDDDNGQTPPKTPPDAEPPAGEPIDTPVEPPADPGN